MKKGVMKKWVKALRSGKYIKGKGRLYREGRYCCLGVLCEEMGIPKNKEEGITFFDGNPLTLSPKTRRKAGIRSPVGRVGFSKGSVSLSELNDRRDRSFKRIAGFIERNWRKL